MKENNRIWLATVISTIYSSPGKIGMKMLIKENSLHGSVGGGTIEYTIVERIRKEQPRQSVKWKYDLNGNTDAEKINMICGGFQEILVEPLFNHRILYIIGGGHCGQALSEFASKCNFNVTVIDDRPTCSNKTVNPFASKIICAPYDEVDKHIIFSDDIFIVVMTSGHEHDKLVIEKLIDKPNKYLGVIGSKNKAKITFELLKKKGFDQDKIQKIVSPIGYSIGSETPNEIAISILAQLIAIDNGII